MIPSCFTMPKDKHLKKVLIVNAKVLVETGHCVGCGTWCPLDKEYNDGIGCLSAWGDITASKTKEKIRELIKKYGEAQLEFVF